MLSATLVAASFALFDVLHFPLPPGVKEKRGWHYALSFKGDTYACGILGELAKTTNGTKNRSYLKIEPEEFKQARTLIQVALPDSPKEALVVSGAAFSVVVPSTGDTLFTAAVNSTALPGDNGMNGMIQLSNGLVVGAAMPGRLNALNLTSRTAEQVLALPRGLSAYDIAIVDFRHAIIISKDFSLIIVDTVTWDVVFCGVPRSSPDLSSMQLSGCNRIRVDRTGTAAFFACYKSNNVGFVDITNRRAPVLVRVVPFVDEQPTGMEVRGDALFVAGGRDLMVFNVSSPLDPSVAATCGAVCTQILPSHGQNAHGLSFSAEGDTHFVHLTAQIDNNLGTIRIVNPAVIRLLQATD